MAKPNQPFIADFKLSITKALATQLHETLQGIETATLQPNNVSKLEPRSGVYELFKYDRGSLARVYVGKAKSDLRARLSQHMLKISGRKGLSLEQIRFKAVYVDEDLDAAAPEKMLIDGYRKEGSVPWNTNGFGNKDPGRNRDRTLVKRNHFDALYPIDLNFIPDGQTMSGAKNTTVEEVLGSLKRAAPFNIRFESHPDLENDFAVAPHVESPTTIDEWIESIIWSLPDGWQATALPGYVIIYRETQDYKAASCYWYRTAEITLRHTSEPSFE
ncbi:Eco29kI family restriction endonuclease [uncultured Corynebacterium sp.]|uniref:Eco29kI family restriction endonuclease n=1 Tax=uncultured Corynebacterium sp. TaxID=159447 RepID=UPI00260FC481|nr:Eco29kI family restriction endonuclease [uncultured Corynebacterium sp.]